MMRSVRLSPSGGCRATVLIIVIWIALGLVSLVLYFSSSILMEYKAADQGQAGLESEQAIEGARRYVNFVLTNLETPGTAPDLENSEYVAEECPVGEASFWLIGRDYNSDVPPSDVVFGLVDEAAKLNINEATAEMLEALPGMDADLAAAIVDWRDADDELTPGGAESTDYAMLAPSYSAKNEGFESPEELRLVMGMDMTVLYGEDTNRNGALDENENDGDASWPPDNDDGILDSGLIEYVTTFAREPNKNADGEARINISQTDAQQELSQMLQEKLGEDRSRQIMTLVGSRRFTSPLEFYIAGQMTPEEFAQIEDSISVKDDDYLVGLVNAGTAPAAVLSALPGMDESLASQLVAARSGKSADELQSIAWVATELDPAVAVQIGPFITSHSYQFSADVAATGHEGRGFRREWMVFDVEDAPKVIYRRDLTRFGWPLGESRRVSATSGAGI